MQIPPNLEAIGGPALMTRYMLILLGLAAVGVIILFKSGRR